MHAHLDVIVPGEELVRQGPKILPVVLILAVIAVVLVAVVTRRKKK